MTRGRHGGKTRRTLAGSSSAWLLPVAIAALAIAALPTGAQHGPTAGTTNPTRPTENDPNRQVRTYAAATSCGGDESKKMIEVRGPGSAPVQVACSLTLLPNDTITRKIVYTGEAASGATLNCTCDQSGCTTVSDILIESPSGQRRPENITVRNCKITGDVNLNNPSFTLCPEGVTESCRDKQLPRRAFEEWVRARAPHRITFDNVTIAGAGGSRFYVGWGVTETKLINSVIEGLASGVPIYLAPSSSRTLIKNNRIRIVTVGDRLDYVSGREAISIDGSDHNQIISNWFGALSRGGIYLYRNCGEHGSIRQTTPSHNHIINNVFYYDHYDGSKPAVFLGSRNGNPPGLEINIPVVGTVGSYCGDDKKKYSRHAPYPDGSSAVDDRDFATHNIVMQNEIVELSMARAIKSTNWENNAMNLVDLNRTVTRATWPRPPAGCYVRGGEKEFILNGETTEMFMGGDGSPTCDKVTCYDGELRPARPKHDAAPSTGVAKPPSGPAATTTAPPTAAPSDRGASFCRTRRVPIDCRITGDNNGCHQTVSCPAGTKVVGAVAACNLENGAVTDAELAAVPPHLIHVAKLSDHVPSGSCYVEGNAVIGKIVSKNLGRGITRTEIPQSAVQSPVRGIAGLTRVAVGCKEYDENGGDCHIRGSLYCR